MSSPSGSFTGTNVKYKTYQSKRSSISSIHSLGGGGGNPSENGSPLAASSRTRASSFTRPSLSQGSSSTSKDSVNVSSSSATQQGPGFTATPAAVGQSRLRGIGAGGQQSNGPSPLSRVNPSTNDLDRFPKSPPPSSPSPQPMFGYQQGTVHPGPSPRAHSSALPARESPRPSSSASGRALQKAPYLAGFQAKGATRLRTDEFFHARKSGTEAKRLEHARLQRRLEKVNRVVTKCTTWRKLMPKDTPSQLVDLHFPHPSQDTSDLHSEKESTAAAELANTLRSKPTASELWFSVRRSIKGSTLRQAEDVRHAEQRIVHWTDDREAHLCALCGIPFSITVRKHHCRLCGRVVCYVPPNDQPPPMARTMRCSTHFVYRWLTDAEKSRGGYLKELEDSSALSEEQEAAQAAANPDSVRSCRDCMDHLLREQAEKFPAPAPTWLKLHRILLQTQDDIERSLPGLQEQLLNPSQSPAALLTTRKKLLALLANYDALARRIRDLPLNEGQAAGGSQERLQRAIASRAAGYLSEKMGLLKGLGSFEDLHSDATSSASSSTSRASSPAGGGLARVSSAGGPQRKRTAAGQDEDKHRGGSGSTSAKAFQERADKLAVLLEQEQLVESYLEQANHKRQLNDAASLQLSLDELRQEIQRLQAS